MKQFNYFDFVDDLSLRNHLKKAQELIAELVILTENKEYEGKESLLSSIRKTIVVHTAALVEAILLWKLKNILKSNEVELDSEWSYSHPHQIYALRDGHEIVWAHRKIVKKQINKLDFLRIIRLCEKFKILNEKPLISNVHKLRELRNNLHIGNLGDFNDEYKAKDLEFGFSILEQVSNRIQDG